VTDQREFTSRIVECPNGHKFQLETLLGTPNMIKKIQCPTCQAEMVVFAGDIRGVVPIEAEG
jgi:hypothetical protein